MQLIHQCPQCGTEHECDSTPEPDKLCPLCDIQQNGNITEVKIKFRTGNCPLTKEERRYLQDELIKLCASIHITVETMEWE